MIGDKNTTLEERDLILDRYEEVFTHKDDDGEIRHFPVRQMFKLAIEMIGKTPEIIAANFPLMPDVGKHIKKNMGIEKDRVRRLKEPYLSKPMIGVLWGDNPTDPVTIIDGNHRYIRLLKEGRVSADIFIFKKSLWQQMLIPLNQGVPKESNYHLLEEKMNNQDSAPFNVLSKKIH